jgi:signal transduction histidine kinase
MSSVRTWLESKQADLVYSLEAAIAKHPKARRLTRSQASALVLALSVAVEQGPSILGNIVQQWDEETGPDDSRSGSWLDTMTAVQEEIWAHIVSEFSPAKALSHLRVLEQALMPTVAFAAGLDQRNRIDQLEAQLQQSQDMVKQVEQSKADFISIAAHELKTPLTLIEGYANMMMMNLPEEEQGEMAIMLGGIANGTYRLRAIIESMIDVSMIDTQVLEIRFQPIYLRNITKMAVNELSDVLRVRQIGLEMDPFPEDGAPTYGDPERLHQAIFNVIGNAIKFTPDGMDIRITNTLCPAREDDDETPRGYICIRVIDSGIGIAPENQERIFDKFSGLGSVALHSTSKYKFKGGGPGLGLAITRGIIEAHGGRVWVESEGYNEERCPGSTFHIYLPLRDAPPED